MKANCTRCSGRACALAPTSSSVTGWPGTGSASASAGRWMPRARLMLNRPAASAAPVPPAHTSACARPSATARAACTIEASGCARAARAGSGLLAIDTGASMTSTPAGCSLDLRGGAEQQHARPPLRRERRARRDLCRSEVGAVGVDRDDHRLTRRGRAPPPRVFDRCGDLAARVGAAHRAHPVRAARAVAARAHAQRGRRDLVLRAALGGAAVRLLLLGDGHGPEG